MEDFIKEEEIKLYSPNNTERWLVLPDEEMLINIKEASELLGLTRFKALKLLQLHEVHIGKPVGHRIQYVLKKDVLALKEKLGDINE